MSSPRTARRASSPRKYRFLSVSVVLRLVLIVFCISATWLIWLDHEIQSKFEGKRWDLPARVYASPLEIYQGQKITADQFEQELRRVGYSRQRSVNKTGEYSRNGNILELGKRRFLFWDKEEKEGNYRLRFGKASLVEIRTDSGERVQSALRLEPQVIGKIFPFHNEDRLVVPYREVPPFLVAALVAVEDRSFFSHSGVDFRGVMRAMLANIKSGKITQGGSTLTQQLVKNYFLSSERTYWRKFNELIMSLLLELRYSKADILATYINEVYLGQHGSRGIHGFATAAEYYFARPLSELREDQLALLVGMVKGASYYNPFRHPERAKSRRNLVLKQMGKLKYAEQELVEEGLQNNMDLATKPTWAAAKFPAFIDVVKRQLLRDYRVDDLRNEGLRVFTTLNPGLQENIELGAQRKLGEIEQGRSTRGKLQIAAVLQNVGNGEIVALMGGRDRDDVSFNRAVDANRAIGSLVKPVVYYAALSQPSKYHVMSKLKDRPLTLKQEDGSSWQPRNYDREVHGDVSMIEALANSYNLASVNLGMEIGLDKVINVLRDLGVEKKIRAYPSLLLGAIELNPLQVNSIYQAFANGGFQVQASSIRAVLTKEGRRLQRYPLNVEQPLAPAPAYLANYLMQEVTSRGTGRALRNYVPGGISLAGKTGTTNDLRDSWFAGFGDDLVVTVWLGMDDNSPTGLTGASGALKIWAEIAKIARIRSFTPVAPGDIEWLMIERGECEGRKKIPHAVGYNPVNFQCH